MITVTGTYQAADGTPAAGTVTFTPQYVARYDPVPALITQNTVTATLDAAGAFSVELLASDDPDWGTVDDQLQPVPVPYIVREDLAGLRQGWMGYVNGPGPVDVSDVVPLGQAPDVYVPVPGPKGDKGDPGDNGDQGPVGPGVAPGGATGEALVKTSGADYATGWSGGFAPLASPAFTGTPTAPTAAQGTNTTQVATTGYVNGQMRVTHPNTDDVLVEQWDDTEGRWQTVHYDSGWRDVAGSQINGWATTRIYMRRLNSIVVVIVANANGSAATGASMLSLPAGFRPFASAGGMSQQGYLHGFLGTPTHALAAYHATQTLHVGGSYTSINGNSYGELQYVTNDPIPTSLPGTLISPAPA